MFLETICIDHGKLLNAGAHITRMQLTAGEPVLHPR